MADYAFTTTWRVAAPIDQVYDAIVQVARWPSWWPGVERVEELQAGDANGIGAVRRFTWKSRLPYRLVFDMTVTRVEAPSLLMGRASGELEGTGIWHIDSDGQITTARYDWNVRTTKAWMNALTPIARPFFAYNHDVVMRWGGEGLARLLNTQLLP